MRRGGALLVLALLASTILMAPAAAAPGHRPPPPDQTTSTLTFSTSSGPITAVVSEVAVSFNPKELSVDKSVPWGHQKNPVHDAPSLEFTSGEPYRLSFELIFDTYESGNNVSKVISPLLALLNIDDDRRPPVCTFVWGSNLPEFEGVIENISVRYTMFLEDGTPVRATTNITFSKVGIARNETRSDPQH